MGFESPALRATVDGDAGRAGRSNAVSSALAVNRLWTGHPRSWLGPPSRRVASFSRRSFGGHSGTLGQPRALTPDARYVDDLPVAPTHVEITEVPADARQIVIEGSTLLRGRTLASLLEEFDGYDGEVVQPSTGKRFTISLDPWRGRDLDSTWLEVAFITEVGPSSL